MPKCTTGKIYVCPVHYKQGNKKSLYLGFRNSGGGQIDTLFKLSQIVEVAFEPNSFLNDCESLKVQLQKINLKDEEIERIIDYGISEKYDKFESTYNAKVFILSQKDIIKLNLPKKPETNNTGLAYYKLAELLDNNNPLLKKKT